MEPLSTIAHRLRTPLTVIMSTVNNLLDGAFGALNAEQTKWLKKLPAHTATLEKILNDILEILAEGNEKGALVGRKLEDGVAAPSAPRPAAVVRNAGTTTEGNVATILIVDDEPDVVDVLNEGLTSQGYRTVTASNAEDAFQHAVASKPDLILMDVLLDRQNGIEVCRRIKEALTTFTPVILVTGQGDLRQKMTGADDEADDLLMKPFQIQELFARVRSMLRLKRLNDKLQKEAA